VGKASVPRPKSEIMKKTCCLAPLLFLVGLANGGWVPPTDGNTYKVLTEAKEDAVAKRYDDALAKHVWVWEHEQISRRGFKDFRAIIGTRMSAGGLFDWVKLAKVSSPALQRLKAIRDEAGQKAQAMATSHDNDWFQALVDFVCINMAMKDYKLTTALFFWLDTNEPKAAKVAFESLEQIEALLINGGDYGVWSRYGDPDHFFRQKAEFYEADEKSPLDTAFGKIEREAGEKYFCNRVAMLVCLLAQDNRADDANRIVGEALKECDKAELKSLLGTARAGHMPAPWWPWSAAIGG